MNGRQKVVLTLEAIVLLAAVAFPPYFGIDNDSKGRVHAQLGYFPAWNPPSGLEVCRALRERLPSPEDCEDRPQAFAPAVNKVRLTLNAAASLAVAAALLLLFRNTPAGEESDGSGHESRRRAPRGAIGRRT